MPGVKHMVCYGDIPAALPNQIIDAIKRETALRNAMSAQARRGILKRAARSNTEGSSSDLLSQIRGLSTVRREEAVLLSQLGQTGEIHASSGHLALTTPDRRKKRPRRTRGRGRTIRTHKS